MIRHPGIEDSDWATMLYFESRALGTADIFTANPITLPASSPYIQVVNFTMPVGHIGILRGITGVTQALADLDEVTWQLRINQAAVIGLDDITGPWSSVFFPKPTLRGLPNDCVVELMAKNLVAVAKDNVTGILIGNFFPRQLVPIGSTSEMGR